MGQAEREKDQLRRAKIRLRRIQHYEQVTKNVSQTCRFCGISRGQFYFWLRRYQKVGFHGLKAQKCGPRKHPFATRPHIEEPDPARWMVQLSRARSSAAMAACLRIVQMACQSTHRRWSSRSAEPNSRAKCITKRSDAIAIRSFDPSNCTLREARLSPNQLAGLERYHDRRVPICDIEPVVVLLYEGSEIVSEGNTRVNKWCGEGGSKPRAVIFVEGPTS